MPQLLPELRRRGLPERLTRALMGPDLSACSPTALAAGLTPAETALLPPIALFHGSADKTAPCAQSIGLAQALRASGAELLGETYYEGASHTDPILEGPLSGGDDPLMQAWRLVVRGAAVRGAWCMVVRGAWWW